MQETLESQNCRGEHPWPFLLGKTQSAFPILCLCVKPSCPPFQTLNETPASGKSLFMLTQTDKKEAGHKLK